ncbi:uncharacterized protein LOC121425973 [Lytechinus variegatus]|uniref:uncharacterized protein LOC121425973 n=1 Tax=Lytechinus variegatus TaxID=7654 RepID=UPI001BB2A81F|nr:uncharacterized protein LOC121425973 [Lytechinus variegatus]
MDQAAFLTRSGAIANDGSNFNKPNECLAPETKGGFKDGFEGASTSPKDPVPFADNVMKTDVGPRETSSHLDEISQKELGAGPGPGGDTSECTESKMDSSHEPIGIDAVMTEIEREVKMECMQWTPIFVESEQFELLSSDHVDKLLRDAHALEENLIEQKERLLSHLKLLSQTLKLNVP